MNYGIAHQEQLDAIENSLADELIAAGAHAAILVDTAGNTIASAVNSEYEYNLIAFSALAAGNFATIETIAQAVGVEEFSLVYHKGKNVSVHFRKVSEDLILLTIFGNEVSLGDLRKNITAVTRDVLSICKPEAPAEKIDSGITTKPCC